jgi:hypothetical protein
MFFGTPRRSLARDATQLLDNHRPRPLITGTENIPKSGAFVMVANHYQRRQLWIGWAGALITEAVNTVRPARTPIRIIVTDSQRISAFGQHVTVPLSRYFLARVAHLWDMVLMPADRYAIDRHATALRMSLSLLKRGLPVLYFPEGDRGTAYRLAEALPGTGTFVALASRYGAILLCGFWEEGERLCGRISPPLTLTCNDDYSVRKQLMTALARLLPETMRGAYTDSIGEMNSIAPGN